jgi:anti-anti-sigma factor
VASAEGVQVVVEALPQGGDVVHVSGELDLASIADLSSALAGSEASGRRVLDLTECTFLDSSAIHVILAEAGRCREEDGELVIVAPQAAVRRPLEIAQVDNIVPIYPSLVDAVR